MARVERTSLPDGYFHVVSRAVCEARIFVDNVDRRRFLRLLEKCERRYFWTCAAYCLMSTHYHLVLEARAKQLSAGMQHLNSHYALGFNRRYRRYGAVFGDRFAVRVVESEEHLFDACAYVVLNPVKAGLCDRTEQWPWSYSAYGPEAA